MTSTIILTKELGAALLMLAVILFGAGYTASETQQPQVEDIEPFNQFAYKAEHVVNPLMQDVIAQPVEYNLLVADNRLNNEFVTWANRETGDDKKLFIEYITACDKVIDDMQDGKEPDTSEMDRLYADLQTP